MLSENTMTCSNAKASHIAANNTKSNKIAQSLMGNYRDRHMCTLLLFCNAGWCWMLIPSDLITAV